MGGVMSILSRNIRAIMLVSGVLTFSMLYAAVAPGAALQGMFGSTLSGPVAEIVVRNWGALIAIGGALLIWGAFHPPVRQTVLVAVGASKVVFIALVLAHGRAFLGGQAGLAIGIDTIWVALYALYLIETRSA